MVVIALVLNNCKLKTKQTSSHKLIDKQTLISSHNRVVFSTYWDTQQHGWISETLCWTKKVRYKIAVTYPLGAGVGQISLACCDSRGHKKSDMTERLNWTDDWLCLTFNCVELFVTQYNTAYQAPLSMGFSRQKCWSGLPFPSLEDSRPRIWIPISCVYCISRQILYHCATCKACGLISH